MIFYTADTHFRYAPLLHNRPFETVEEMDEALISYWNSVVSPEDTVYVLGDIGFNNGHIPCRILARLAGHKHLIRGNHDTGFEDAPLLHRYFESVTDFLEIDDGGQHILLSHYPMLYNKKIGYMIHGHLHGQGGFFHEILRSLPRVLNAGVDVNDFRPVTLEELIANNEKFYAEPLDAVPVRRNTPGALPPIPDFRPIPEKPLPHPKHLFLTGPKQIGKSTALRKLLQDRDAKIGGFRTVRVPLEDGASIHMVSPSETEFTDKNRIFSRRKGVLNIDPSDFDRIGCGLLAESCDCDLILMDELGPNEASSLKFRQAVLDTLDGDTPVYGILQMADSVFLDIVASRPDVLVITVTEENRNNLPHQLLTLGW